MANTKSAMPSYLGGKRILFPNCENFGPGSYDPVNALHTGMMRQGCIIPCESTITTESIVEGETIHTIKTKKLYNGFPLIIFEN